MVMKIEVKKEINLRGIIWYRLYVDDNFVFSYDTAGEAIREAERIKKQKVIETSETIYSETI